MLRKVPLTLSNVIKALVALAFAATLLVTLIYGIWALSFDLEKIGQMPQRSAVYDMDGNLYSRMHGENRILLPEGKIPKNFKNALLAREDSRFYKHFGIDLIGVARAAVRNVASGSIREGGSTITQQLAKNSYSLGGRSLHRKLLEAMLALRMERRFSKDEILAHYMNRIYYGAGVYGIETASLQYFDKTSDQLTIGQAAMLAGLIRSPTRFSPFSNPEGAKEERDVVLSRMEKLKFIDATQGKAARKGNIGLVKRRSLTLQENYAMDAVRRDLDLILADKHVDEGGLRIYTTFDPKLMQQAARSLEGHLSEIEKSPGYKQARRAQFTAQQRKEEAETPYLQGAVVVIDNRTGGIRALVGGRDFEESKYNRALMAKRQIGSSFKPFVYAAAFEKGLFPGTLVSDGPLNKGEIRSVSTNWNPENSDGDYKGNLPAREGLVQSRNTMSVRVGEMGGLDRVRELAKRAGLGESIPRLPAIYLGAFESTLKDVTSAYSIFPNNGVRKQAYIIERIDDVLGRPIYRAAHVKMQAMAPDVAWMTSNVLQGVLDRGTGAAARKAGFKSPAGGKTGTTNDYTDAWFVGYTKTLTCGVWVGLDRPGRIMDKAYGSRLALPVWTSVMKAAPEKRYPATDFPSPVKLVRLNLCAGTGQVATRSCNAAGLAYEIDLPANRVPTVICSSHEGVIVRNDARRSRSSGSREQSGFVRRIKRLFGR